MYEGRNNDKKEKFHNSSFIKQDFYSLEIKNLEVLYNQAYMLNKVFKIKDFVLHSPTLQRKIVTLEKWKVVRNICLAIILIGRTLLD
jgi:hypothetical protein